MSEGDIQVILHRLDELDIRLCEIHDEVKRTNGRVTDLEISTQLLQAKVGKRIKVIVDAVNGQGGVGRSQSDAPEIDGLVHLLPTDKISKKYRVGEFVKATVVGTQGHDLIAQL